MLPSFRLIVATFCCGFIMVLVGLRLATSVSGIHQAMPVMAAHAAPVMVSAISSQDPRRSPAAVPATYELRFAVSATQPAPTPAAAAPVMDRAPPLLMPLVILPPIAQDAAASEPPEQTAAIVVAALPARPASESAPATIDLPLPEPAAIDLTFLPPAKPKENPIVAAVAPQATPPQSAPTIDIPLPEPAIVDLTFQPSAKPGAEVGPDGSPESGAILEKRPETDARAASANESDARPLTVAALPIEIPVGTVRLPAKGIPLPKPRGVEHTAALHPMVHTPTRTAAAKAKPRRRATAQRNDFDNFFGFPSGKPR